MKFFLAAIATVWSAIKKTTTVIVVEIGNDWLKIVEGKVVTGGIGTRGVHFVKLSEIKGSVSDALGRIFKDNKWSKHNVLLCLPRHLVTTRILELPSVNLKEIDDIIGLHIGKQTPYAREEIIYSYKVIGSGKEGYARVFLAIARRNLVNERVDILAKAFIKPKKIALSSEGVSHWFNTFYARNLMLPDSQAVVLIDIDSNYSDFIVTYKGNLWFSKSILIGANHLIEEKNVYLSKFADEVSHSIKIFNEELNNIKLVRIFLSGAAKNIGDLDEHLKAQFGLPCEVIDPFNNLLGTDKGQVTSTNTRFISLTPAFGILAQHKKLEFDLMPSETRMEQMMEEKRKNLTLTGILFSAIILTLSILMAVYINNKNVYIAELKSKADSMKSASDDVDRMRLVVDLVHERLDASGDVLNLLNEIYKLIPKEVYLTDIDLENSGKIVLKGRANTISDVYKFVTTLAGSVFFEKVRNTYATSKEENNNAYADFEIVAEYKKINKR